MITITRLLAKQIRKVFRRALGLSNSALPHLPIRFKTTPTGLTIEALFGGAAVRYQVDNPLGNDEIVASLGMLKELEGARDDALTLDLAGDQIVASWQEKAVPRSKQFYTIDEKKHPAMPPLPEVLSTNGPELREALAAALDSAQPYSSRYALSCIQLRGKEGIVAASDAHEVYRHAGFAFPFEQELLVERPLVFTLPELAGSERVSVGATDNHAVFGLGPWTFWLPLQTEAKFPRVDDVIPAEDSAKGKLDLAEVDAKFLLDNLARLPANESPESPITLDLNGSVAVRSRPDDGTLPIELVLTNSCWTGTPSCINTNRKYLERAIKLGFRQVQVFGDESPAVCRDSHRNFVWALLSGGDGFERTKNTVSIPNPQQATTNSPPRSTSMKRRPTIQSPVIEPAANTEQSAAPEQTPPTKQRRTRKALEISLVDQAQALRSNLRDLLKQSAELVRSIKRQRQADRVLRSTLASLKQLQAVA